MALRLLHHNQLEFPKVSRELMHWKNTLSSKKGRVSFSLADPETTYTVGIYSNQSTLENYPLGLLIEIDGVPASLWLTHWPLENQLKEYLGGKELNKLPVDLRAELLEIVFKSLLSIIILHTNTKIRILNFLKLKPSDINGYSLGISLKNDKNTTEVKMIMPMHDKLQPVIQRIFAYWPDQNNDFWYQQKTQLWLEAGILDLTINELNQLDASDILLMEPSGANNDQLHIRLGSGDFFYAVRQSNNPKQITIESGIQKMTDENFNDTTNDHHDEIVTSLEDVPVRLTFDLGDLVMPFSEIKSLTPGYLIELNIPVSQAVTIRSLNKVIGVGELVNIDGRMGVRIVKLLSQHLTQDEVVNNNG